MPIRAIPRAGERVTVVNLAARERGTIEWVADDLHRLRVLTDDGEVVRFALSQAKARWVAETDPTGPRLIFDTSPDDKR